MSEKVVIVTGATSGIGAATAKLLGSRGYSVCVNYRTSREQAEAIAASLPRAIAVQGNIMHESHILKLFEKAERELGPVTALVNNAGLSGERTPFADMPFDAISPIFAANVYGTMLCCREALRRMKPGGAIVNLSSMAAFGGGNQMSAYAASKGAVNSFTVGLAREAAALGIRVNAVAPGVIATEANADISDEKRSSLPMGRMGTTDEVAEAIAWLLSDAASYVSGSILPVSGAR